MKDIKKIFNLVTIGTMALDALLIVLGLFLMANPAVGVESALVLLGVVLLISGIYSIIKYIMNNSGFYRFELVYGTLSVISGIFAIIKPFGIASLITIIVGVWLILTSIVKLSIALELRKIKEETWVFDLTISVLTIILGLLLLINPFNGYIVLSTYAGVMIVIYAAMDIVEQTFIRKRAKTILKVFSK